jgi:hypothetical protein
MKTRFLAIAFTVSALLSGWSLQVLAADAKEEAKQEFMSKKAEFDKFHEKVKALDLDRRDEKELEEIKRVLMISKLKHKDEVMKFMSFFGANSEALEFAAEALDGLNDDELISAFLNNRKRNMEFVGDAARKIEDGKKAEQILAQIKKMQMAESDLSFVLPNADVGDGLIIQDYIGEVLKKITVKLEKIPEDPAHIALIFKNDTRDFSLSKLSMTINIKADGRDVPYYTVENLYYPFMTPLKPGEEKKEIISCGDDCRKAMTHENVYGAFEINDFYARVAGSNRLLHIQKLSKWDQQQHEKSLKTMDERKNSLQEKLKHYTEEQNNLRALLK